LNSPNHSKLKTIPLKTFLLKTILPKTILLKSILNDRNGAFRLQSGGLTKPNPLLKTRLQTASIND
jgi:hypothetical protein